MSFPNPADGLTIARGDIHQPLHTANGYFNDASHGYLPYGDRGGNRLGCMSSFVWSKLGSLWDIAIYHEMTPILVESNLMYDNFVRDFSN